MTDQMITLALLGGIPTGLGTLAFGIAAIVRETYLGRALLLKAKRGDPELADRQTAVPRVHRSVRRGRRIQAQLSWLPE